MVKREKGKSYVAGDVEYKWFEDEVNYWISKYGLIDWELETNLKQTEEGDSYGLGYCYTNFEHRYVELSLCTWWGEWKPTEYECRKTGFHEVMELLLARLKWIGKSRFEVPEFSFDEEIHRIVRTLENVFWEKECRKRLDNPSSAKGSQPGSELIQE